MAYDEDKINIPIFFTQGLDTKTDEKLVVPGRLLTCKNGQFQKSAITKRFGSDFFSVKVVNDSDLTEGHTYLNYKDELLLIGNGNQLLSRLPSSDQWLEKGRIYLSSAEQETLVFNWKEQSHCDAAFQDGVEGYAWEDSRGGVRYTVRDRQNGVSYIEDEVLDASGTDPQVCGIDGFILFFYCVSGGLFMRKVSTANPSVTEAEIEVTTGLNTTTPLLQVRTMGVASLLVVYETSGNVIKFHYVTAQGDVGDIGNGFPNPVTISENPVVLCLEVSQGDGSADPILGATRFAIGWGTATNVKFQYYDDTFLDVYSGAQTIEALGDISNMTITHAGANDEMIYFYYEDPDATDPQNTLIKYASSNVSTQSAPSPTVFLRSVGLASQAFQHSDNPHVLLTHESKNGLQNTLFLSVIDRNDSDSIHIILKLTPGESEGITTKPRLPKVSFIEANTYLCPTHFKDVLEVEDSQFFSSIGLKRNVFTFDEDTLPLSSLQHGQHLFIAAGILLSYDAKGLTEAGFHCSPEGLTVADGGAGNIEDGDYQYSAIYRYYNNQGELERSTPSVPIDYTVSSGPKQNDVTVPTLRLTDKENVVIELYRNERNGGTIFYKVGEDDNDTTTDTVVIVDDIADANLTTNEPLYSTGFIIENSFSPSPKTIEEHQTRLFLVPRENDNFSIYSKRHARNIFTELVEQFETRPTSKKSITAQKSLDNSLIIFSRDDIFGIVGEGPDETGVGPQYSEPQEIHGDVGSVDGIVAKVPEGLVFKSAKGIYLLTRGLSVQYIGADVEDFNSFNITSATLVDDLNEVRFTTQEGTTLVYHYLTRQWSTFEHKTNIEDLSVALGRTFGTLWENEWTYLALNGRGVKENKTKFKDGALFYPMQLESAWIKTQNLVAGLQRITQCTLTGEYKSAHLLRIKVAYDYEDAWVDRYYFSTVETLADGTNYFGSDLKFGVPGPVFFYDRFAGNNDSNWTNVTTQGGPITVTNRQKHVYSSGITADDLGFWGLIQNSGGPLTGNIVQCELSFDANTTSAIALASLSKSTGIDYVNSVSIEFNSFPTPEINFFDYGGNPVSGATPLAEFDLTKKYVGKFVFNADGTVSAYIEATGVDNHLLGTTSVATDFDEGPVYFSTNQTYILPEANSSIWDDIFFHQNGLTFDYEAWLPEDNNYFGGISSNVYQFRFFLSRPKCQAVKFFIEDLVDESLGTPVSGESFSVTELMLTAKLKPQPKKFGTTRSLDRVGVSP